MPGRLTEAEKPTARRTGRRSPLGLLIPDTTLAVLVHAILTLIAACERDDTNHEQQHVAHAPLLLRTRTTRWRRSSPRSLM
jgi:hypothetical protein